MERVSSCQVQEFVFVEFHEVSHAICIYITILNCLINLYFVVQCLTIYFHTKKTHRKVDHEKAQEVIQFFLSAWCRIMMLLYDDAETYHTSIF